MYRASRNNGLECPFCDQYLGAFKIGVKFNAVVECRNCGKTFSAKSVSHGKGVKYIGGERSLGVNLHNIRS